MTAIPAAPPRVVPLPGTRSLVRAGLVVACVVAWFLLVGPRFLGGPMGYVVVSGDSMQSTMHNGDLVLAREQDNYGVGDVIVYRVPEGDPAAGAMVVHRIVGGSAEDGYITRGDNRDRDDIWRPKPDDIVGRAWLHLPHTGSAITYLKTPLGLAAIGGLLTIVLFWKVERRPAKD